MYNRKEMKARGRASLKKHYLLFITICLVAGLLGSEYVDALSILKKDMDTYFTHNSQAEEPLAGNTGGIVQQTDGLTSLIRDIYDNNIEKGQKSSEELIKEYEKENNGALSRSSGVLADTLNMVTSGSIIIKLAQAIEKVVHSYRATAVIIVILSFALIFLFWMLIQKTYIVISRRMFLEGRLYSKVPFSRFVFLREVKCWWRASVTILYKSVLKYLWNLTIIGGIIKRYSYYMVPYIVAENPKISAKKAVNLSRRMMNGHKWECFKFELSYLGWLILGLGTLGLTELFYSNPYRIAALCEYYAYIRELAIENKIEDYELLNNKYLFEKADPELLAEKYPEADYAAIERARTLPEGRTKVLKVILDFFGVMIFPSKYELEYEQNQEAALRASRVIGARNGEMYPLRLSPLWLPEHSHYIGKVHYIRHYSIYSLILIFFVFSIIGWCWEVSYCALRTGDFVNRGTLHGPWLPVYGSGGVVVLLLLNKLRKRPVAEFFSIMALCGIIEYATSWVLEQMHNGMHWWDYSGCFLNLNGRICAEGLLLFAIGGMAGVYVIAPRLDNVIRKIKHQIVLPLCAVLIVCFVADSIYSSKHPNEGKGVTSQTVVERQADYMTAGNKVILRQ